MSGSEAGVMTSRGPFNVGVQNSSLQSQPAAQNMRLAYGADGTPVYKPVTPSTTPSYQSSMAGVSGNVGIEGSAGGGSMLPHGFNINSVGSEQIKKKRGRPRKYGPDGSMALALGSGPPSGSGGFSPSPMANSASEGLASPNSLKKSKGRPPGSKKKQQLEALGNYYKRPCPILLQLGSLDLVLAIFYALSFNVMCNVSVTWQWQNRNIID